MLSGKSICTVCNYIYDETSGESIEGILPLPKFKDLPDEWRCPECGSSKEMFQPCSCVSFPMHEQNCVALIKNELAENTVDKTQPVGKLLTQHPLWACVLEQYGIDYCCGGKTTLEEACRKKGLQVEEILEKLIAAEKQGSQSNEPDWTKVSLRELTEHIVKSYHEPLRNELHRLTQLAEKVAKVHGDNHPEMIDVLKVLNGFRTQLELHMKKEETILFPGIVNIEAGGDPKLVGCGGGIEHPIEVMSQEHDEAGEAISTMRKLTNKYTPPDDACNTFKALLYSLAQIEYEMHQHVHKENNILFPRALKIRQPSPARG